MTHLNDVCRIVRIVSYVWRLSPNDVCRSCYLLSYYVCPQLWRLSLIGFVAKSKIVILSTLWWWELILDILKRKTLPVLSKQMQCCLRIMSADDRRSINVHIIEAVDWYKRSTNLEVAHGGTLVAFWILIYLMRLLFKPLLKSTKNTSERNVLIIDSPYCITSEKLRQKKILVISDMMMKWWRGLTWWWALWWRWSRQQGAGDDRVGGEGSAHVGRIIIIVDIFENDTLWLWLGCQQGWHCQYCQCQ